MVGIAGGNESRAKMPQIGALTVLAALGCGDVKSDEQPAVDTAVEELSTFGAERVVPLRIVMMANNCALPQSQTAPICAPEPDQTVCSNCSDSDANCGPDTADYADIRRTVMHANFAMRAVGVQVVIRSIEKYLMPLFWDLPSGLGSNIAWSNVSLRANLRKPFPNLLDTTFLNIETTKEAYWLNAATTRVGDPREIVIFVAECSHGWDGRRPWDGGSSMVADREMFKSPRQFAHELGHILGLEHTFDTEEDYDPFPGPHKARNPELQADFGVGAGGGPGLDNKYEYWDLMYKSSGAPAYFNTFFTNRTEAQAASWLGPLHTINAYSGVNNCTADANCTLSCELYDPGWGGQVLTTGDSRLRGLAFVQPGDVPPFAYRRGINAMTYMSISGRDCPWASFSESQADQVKRYLRADIRVDSTNSLAPYSKGYTSRRHLLGDWRVRTEFSAIDVDGDNRHDFGVWQPPGTDGAGASLGRFIVRQSTASTYSSELQRDFGRNGDIPMLADYDADGKTDLAVLRTGGLTTENPYDGAFWWVWCKSSASHDCVNYGSISWGSYGDVPLPGLEFDGNGGTREVTVYTSSTKKIRWKVISSGATGEINLSTYFGGLGSKLVHLHGLYDADSKTDVVVYEPDTATFRMLLSTESWATAKTRAFSSTLVANAITATDAGTGAAAKRFGGVPMVAQKDGRRVLRVFDPHSGHWYTSWDATSTSWTIQSCQWGGGHPREIPVPGPIDRNANGQTDLVVYRPQHVVGSVTTPMIFIKSPPSTTDCGPNTSPTTLEFGLSGTPRTVISFVPDMKGSDDGYADLMLLDSDTLGFSRFLSQNFTTSIGVFVGGRGAMAL